MSSSWGEGLTIACIPRRLLWTCLELMDCLNLDFTMNHCVTQDINSRDNIITMD